MRSNNSLKLTNSRDILRNVSHFSIRFHTLLFYFISFTEEYCEKKNNIQSYRNCIIINNLGDMFYQSAFYNGIVC